MRYLIPSWRLAAVGVFLSWLFIATNVVGADDWPQWMGPNRDGVWHESGIVAEFRGGEATIDWRVECGLGYAGPAYAGGKVFLFDYVKSGGELENNPGKRATLRGEERLRCLDAKSGEVIWARSYDSPYTVSYPSGPRCTPTVKDDAVYTLGAMGHLSRFDRGTGELEWQVDLPTKFDAAIPIWGFASHPLVATIDGRTLVFTNIGGPDQAFAAFDAGSGDLVWSARSSRDAGYCAPSMIKRGDRRELVCFSPAEVAGLDPLSGRLHWASAIDPDYGMSVNVPQPTGDGGLLVTSYGKTKKISLSVEGSTDDEGVAVTVWDDPGPRSLFTCNSTPLVVGDFAVGCDINSGLFRAIRLSDGSQLWQTKEPLAPLGHDKRWRTRHATAFITRLGDSDRFALFNDLGELVLCRITQDGYVETGRAAIVEPTGEAFGRRVVWSQPAYADRSAFVRNDVELVRVNLAAE